jgi:PAS domain S-box-containing protein
MSKKKCADHCSDLHCADIDIDFLPYFEAFLNAPIPVLLASEDNRCLMINHAFHKLTGLSHQEVPTVEALTDYLVADPDSNGKNLTKSLFDPQTQMEPLRVVLNTKTSGQLTWELFSAPLGQMDDGQKIFIIAASDITEKVDREARFQAAMKELEREVVNRTRDLNATIIALEKEIAERKRVEDALILSRRRLKQMSRRTLDVLEADRKTVSKELHDSIGANLAAIKFSLEEKELRRDQTHGRLEDSLNTEIDSLLATIKETKRISANLRPTTLDDLGLLATVQWYLRQLQNLFGDIRILYKTSIAEEDIPETMKIIIYRIVQESLSNAAKHSGAASVHLTLGFTDGNRSVSLCIEDNGRGFDVEKVISNDDPLSGYGLTSMKERCEILGGTFEIESTIGEGTKIKAALPL